MFFALVSGFIVYIHIQVSTDDESIDAEVFADWFKLSTLNKLYPKVVA